ncbi:MAG: hypothetical protein E6Q88_09905 [Lysobacteraceae bacterium]|nr:MAG: hypothetical protein E6Q88_09905 [Xanthomonadaceae bacterium]
MTDMATGIETRETPGGPPSEDNGILWSYGVRLIAFAKSAFWLATPLAGLMLLAHFWRVGHLPALSFSELGVVLAAFGLFVVMGLAVALLLILLPVYMLFSSTEHSLMPAPPKQRRPAQGPKRRSLSRRPLPIVESDATVAKRRTFSLKVAPGAFGLFVATSVTAVALSMAALLLMPPEWRVSSIMGLWWFGLLLPFAVEMWAQIGLSARALRRMRRVLPQFVLMLALYLFLWPAWIVLLTWFDAWPESVLGWVVTAMVALLWAPWMHWLWYATMRRRGAIVTEVRVVTSIVVLLYAGLATPLIDGAASAYGFGMLRKVDLLLSARGCAIVRVALPGQACIPAPTPGDAALRMYRLRGVDVLTRIGAHYVIAPAGGIDDRSLLRVTLPADEVHALVRRVEATQ